MRTSIIGGGNSGYIFLFLLALCPALLWNTWNLSVMRGLPDVDEKLRHGWTIATHDDVSYLRSAEDLLRKLKRIEGESAMVVRAPGYGLHYFLLRLGLPPGTALPFLALFQTMLFAFALLLAWHAMRAMAIGRSIRLAFFLLVALMPTFHGFLFYTLTEGVTPSYLLICAGCSVLYWKHPQRWWLIIGAIAWAVLTLTRPVLVWGGLPLLLAILHHTPWRGRAFLVLSVALLPLLGWITIESIRSGYIISPHPVYHPASTGIFRPTHKAFWDLGKSWGMKGAEFHVIMEGGFYSALQCVTPNDAAEAFVRSAPSGHLDGNQTTLIRKAFDTWGAFTCEVHGPILIEGGRSMVEEYEQEQIVVALVKEVTQQYRREHPVHHHLVVPTRVLKELIVHSNLNLYMFQHTWRGLWWMEALRWFSFSIHVPLLVLPFAVLFMSIPKPLRALALLMVLYLLALAYIQRGVEERYTLPVLLGSVLLLPFVIAHLQGYIRSRN